MFDDILNLVKEHLGNNPQIAAAIPADQADAVHNEIATHISNGLANQPVQQTQPVQESGFGGLLEKLESGVASGGPLAGAIEGGLVSSLASKFGFSPLITGAIAGALPGILQKVAQKQLEGKIR